MAVINIYDGMVVFAAFLSAKPGLGLGNKGIPLLFLLGGNLPGIAPGDIVSIELHIQIRPPNGGANNGNYQQNAYAHS